jgi:alpha-L-rhamnosidase
MNSFNHYAYGAIGDWMYKSVAGINYDARDAGYKKIIIAPKPGGDFTNASAKLESLYGTIQSSWKLEGEKMSIDVIIPANTNATIVLPSSAKSTIVVNNSDPNALAYLKKRTDDAKNQVFEAGSGTYHFEYAITK